MWPAKNFTTKWSLLLHSLPSRGRILPTPVLSCRCYGYIHVAPKKVPHILGPGWLWRKCFIVHPSTQTLDPLTKYQWLTKSVIVNDLPEQLISAVDPPEDGVLRDFQKRAEDFLAFQVCSHPRWQPFTKLELSSFFQSTLASTWSLGNLYDHIVQSHLTYSRNIKCYWRRNGENYLCISDPLYVLRTTKALGLFCEPDFQGGTTIPPLQYKPSHLGLFEHSVDQILPSGGVQSRSPFPMAHTLFIHDHNSQSVEQLHAHGLMQLFAQSAAEAVQNGFKLDADLPYPLVNQGVLTDGQTFTFVCFQLNTLDFRKETEDSGGANNVFWAGPSLKLYASIQEGEQVEGFNDKCAGLLLKFVLNKPIRQRPRLWGYGRHAMSERQLRTEGQQLGPLTDSINSTLE